MTRATVSVVVVAALAAFAPSAHAVRDFSSTARNIIPSGQWGGVPPVPQADGQAKLYDGLTPLFDDISNGDLNRYFKSERLGTKGQGPLKRELVPRKGVRIIRDRFNVPHIYGKTDDDGHGRASHRSSPPALKRPSLAARRVYGRCGARRRRC